MSSFTAIDFETAHGHRWSICQVGLVRVENGIIIDEIDLLVQPPNNFYWWRFTQIHGIDAQRTANSPTFDEVWPIIEPFISGQTVVAHNGLNFDFPVLEHTLAYYDMFTPYYDKVCTYKIYRKGLAKLCQMHDIPLNHHDALSDAKACAELYLRAIEGKE
jgi:DNA polymerase-3 subunit epsilon